MLTSEIWSSIQSIWRKLTEEEREAVLAQLDQRREEEEQQWASVIKIARGHSPNRAAAGAAPVRSVAQNDPRPRRLTPPPVPTEPKTAATPHLARVGAGRR